MKILRATCCCAMLILVGAAGAAEEEPALPNAHQTFSLAAPTEFRGVWNRQFAPFIHPSWMQNWANVRVETVDASDGTISGHFDVYVRNICSDVIDQPFKGTFDGKTLRLRYEFIQCPGMKPLHLTLWKEADGFHGRTMGLPITINKVIPTVANPSPP